MPVGSYRAVAVGDRLAIVAPAWPAGGAHHLLSQLLQDR